MATYELSTRQSIYALSSGDTLDLLSLGDVSRGVQFFIIADGSATISPYLTEQINFNAANLSITEGEYVLISAGPGSTWYVIASTSTSDGGGGSNPFAGTAVLITDESIEVNDEDSVVYLNMNTPGLSITLPSTTTNGRTLVFILKDGVEDIQLLTQGSNTFANGATSANVFCKNLGTIDGTGAGATFILTYNSEEDIWYQSGGTYGVTGSSGIFVDRGSNGLIFTSNSGHVYQILVSEASPTDSNAIVIQDPGNIVTQLGLVDHNGGISGSLPTWTTGPTIGGYLRFNSSLEAGAKRQGTATLSSGTATVTTTAITATSQVFLTHKGTGTVGNIGSLYLGTVNAGTNFQIKSTNGSDNDAVFWMVVEP